MNLINQSCEKLFQKEYDYIGIIDHIRSCSDFIDKQHRLLKMSNFIIWLEQNGWLSIMEHGTAYIEMQNNDFYITHKYFEIFSELKGVNSVKLVNNTLYVTVNFRILNENNLINLRYTFVSPHKIHHEKRYTFKLIVSRDVAQIFMKNKDFSITDEFQQNCEHLLKTGVTYIIPSWCDNFYIGKFITDSKLVTQFENNYEEKETNISATAIFYNSLLHNENDFFRLINRKCEPEMAMNILYGSCKHEIYVTGTKDQWKNFFDITTKEYDKFGRTADLVNLSEQILSQIP